MPGGISSGSEGKRGGRAGNRNPTASTDLVARQQVAGKKPFAERAPRFDLALPLRYRKKGTAGWFEGKTMNVSVSGVLFRAAQMLPLRTKVEIAVTIPSMGAGKRPANFGGRGTIIRVVSGLHEAPVLAASVANSRFLRGRRQLGDDPGSAKA